MFEQFWFSRWDNRSQVANISCQSQLYCHFCHVTGHRWDWKALGKSAAFIVHLKGLAVCACAAPKPDSDAAGLKALNDAMVEGAPDGYQVSCLPFSCSSKSRHCRAFLASRVMFFFSRSPLWCAPLGKLVLLTCPAVVCGECWVWVFWTSITVFLVFNTFNKRLLHAYIHCFHTSCGQSVHFTSVFLFVITVSDGTHHSRVISKADKVVCAVSWCIVKGLHQSYCNC